MNLTGIALGGMMNQQNTAQELGLKSGALQLQAAQRQMELQKAAGERADITFKQAQDIVSNLPNRQAMGGVMNTLNGLKQDWVALQVGAGRMNPNAASQLWDSAMVNTPTIADQAGKAGTIAGATEGAKAPFDTVVVPPGGSVVPKSAVVGGGVPAPAIAPPAMGGGAGAMPAAGGGVGGSAPMGAGGVPAVPGMARNGAGGFTNMNSPALINLNQGNRPAYLEETGKNLAAFIQGKQTAVAGYQDSLNQIGQLRQTLTQIPTGGATITAGAANLQKFAQRFGIDLAQYLPAGANVDPTKYDIANKAITQLATAFAKSNFPTRITNNDMAIAIAATPNFGNTVAANKDLLDNLEGVARLRLAEAKFFRQRAAQVTAAGGTPDWQIIDDWQQTLDQMKGVSPGLKQAYASADTAPQVGGGSIGAKPDYIFDPSKGLVPAP